MFHKSKTDVERQQVFDSYMLSILKEREVIKKNKKSLKKKILTTTRASMKTKSKERLTPTWIVLLSRIF